MPKKTNGNGTGRGWEWLGINPDRCGRYALGVKYRGVPFRVRSCHNDRTVARKEFAKYKASMIKFIEVAAPWMPGIEVQLRDHKDGGKIVTSYTIPKPKK